jgi:hypothetical protein
MTSRNSTANPRRRRNNRRVSQVITFSRTEFVDAVPAPTAEEGLFVSAMYANPLSFYGSQAIADAYTEFRFTNLVYTIIPKAHPAAGGQLVAAHEFTRPEGQPGDLRTLSSMAGFRCRPTHLGQLTAVVPLRLSTKRWYRVPQALTPDSLLDPDCIQSWSFVGHNNPGRLEQIADVHVRYTVQLRAPRLPDVQLVLLRPLQPALLPPSEQVDEQD